MLYKEKTGSQATLINPRFITGIDNETLELLKRDHELVVTIEDGILSGGFGSILNDKNFDIFIKTSPYFL